MLETSSALEQGGEPAGPRAEQACRSAFTGHRISGNAREPAHGLLVLGERAMAVVTDRASELDDPSGNERPVPSGALVADARPWSTP